MMQRTCTALLLLLIALPLATAFAAPRYQKITPPMGPADFSETRYLSHVSSDWRDSDRFDFENPIYAQIRIHGIELPEDGYAVLLFSYDSDESYVRPADLPPDTRISTIRRATLQTTNEVNRLRVKKKDLEAGLAAEVTGWPATRLQLPYSELLVDEIILSGKGKTYVFHPDNDKMVKYRDRDKPRSEARDDGPAIMSDGD
jgi:hypothetical protein